MKREREKKVSIWHANEVNQDPIEDGAENQTTTDQITVKKGPGSKKNTKRRTKKQASFEMKKKNREKKVSIWNPNKIKDNTIDEESNDDPSADEDTDKSSYSESAGDSISGMSKKVSPKKSALI